MEIICNDIKYKIDYIHTKEVVQETTNVLKEI